MSTHFARPSRPTIGLLTSIVHRHQPLWVGAADAARERNANLICFIGSELPASNQINVPYLYTFDFQGSLLYDLANADCLDGLITWAGSGVGIGVRLSETEMAQFIESYRALPVVNYEGVIASIPNVVTDTYQGMCELITHLIKTHGCRHIALIRGPAGHMESEDRHRAYLDTLTHYGLPIDPRIICPPAGWGIAFGARMVGLLLDERGLQPGCDFDAIAATEIDYAMGTMQVLQARGIRVPDQVAIVGFNDRTDARSLDPPITVMRKPFYASGRRAVEAVLDLIEGNPVPSRIAMPCELVIRCACGCHGEQNAGIDLAQDWAGPYDSLNQIQTKADQIIDRSRNLLEISRQMMNAATVPQLTDILARRLPELGILDSYITLYETPQPFTYLQPAPEWSRLVLAIQEGQRIPLEPEGWRFRSHHLVPNALLPDDCAHALMATPLYFGRRQFGFALFQAGPRDGLIYQALAQEISSALQSVFLLGEYHQTERALRESEARMRTLLEYMPVAFWAKGTDGKYIMQNSAMRQLVGDQVGLTLEEIEIDEALRAKWKAEDEHVFNGEIVHSEHTLWKEDQERAFQQIIAPVQVDGKTTAIIGIMFDVTELHQAKEAADEARQTAEQARLEAESANQAKSRFLANMSHELRTPLNAILGFADLIARDKGLIDRHRQNLEIIGRSGEHLLALINQVLELSKIEAGKIDVQPERFDLHEMILGLGEMFSLRAEQKGLSVVFDLESGTPQYIYADAGKLRQVLINLLSNATKFTDRGGITLRVKHGARTPEMETTQEIRLVFEVEDTGIGIAPAELERIFDAFVQAESGWQAGQGTGLGLTISREYVRLMGGTLTAHSQVDVGSTFHFNLPVQVVTEPQTIRMSSAQRAIDLAPGQQAPDGGPYRLLVADDEANRQLLVQLLEPLGFDVQEACDGQEAVSIWRVWQPHLIWMDASMPVLDGPSAARQIKSDQQGADAVIVLVTASAFEEEKQRMLEMGGDDVIRKPFREAQILDALTRHLGVRFIYKDDNTAESAKLDPDRLLDVPGEWRSAMHQALVIGDIAQMSELIEQLPGPQALLAELRTRIEQFEHESILEWIEGAQG
ncbi:MAG: substrate-binding domain-containing protein [Anaerolineae bacterium]|nr:substrate-binding domain-containing protein [Anaerolineae bacterium]